MKETIFRYAKSIRVRIISAFLAVLIIFAGLPYVGAEASDITTSTKVSGLIENGTARSTQHDGSGVTATDGETLNYTYTGKIKTANTNLYDYLTDGEINNQGVSMGSEDGGYYDPYYRLNTAISNYKSSGTSIISEKENNITIKFKLNSITLTSASIVRVNFSNYTSWPGIDMEYDSDSNDGSFVYTFNPTTLGYTPNKFIFNYINNDSDSWQTDEITQSVSTNHTYTFTADIKGTENSIIYMYKTSDTSTSRNIYLWNSSKSNDWPGKEMNDYDTNYTAKKYTHTGFVPEHVIFNTNFGKNKYPDRDIDRDNMAFGHTYYYEDPSLREIFSVTCSTSDSSKDIYGEAPYQNPLYFGAFFYSNNANDVGYTDSSKKPQKTGSTKYNNFWWQANMGLKNIGSAVEYGDNATENDVNGFKVRGRASVQGLVDDTLTGGNITQNSMPLPYFNNSSEIASYMKYYPDLTFPFYEVLADANKVKGTDKDGNGTTGTTGEKARFYQFNSEDINLYLNNAAKVEDTTNQYTGTFSERTTKIGSSTSNPGFFTFNEYNSKETNADGSTKQVANKNNLGFGMKMEIKFKLNEQGTVSALNENGEKITDKAPSQLHTMFEFLGDDDLWVFIDDQLILDMGGVHNKSSGLIDFYTKTATANKAISLGDDGKDNLGVDNIYVKERTVQNSDFIAKLKSGNPKSFINKDGAEVYNPDVTHTMTIFYMERGMFDSNLMIRFNYALEANFTKMKIQEITNFDNINPGLVNATKQAAENDVFTYTIENKGTTANSVGDSGAYYPTYDTYLRDHDSITPATKLTGQTLQYVSTTDSESVFLDARGSLSEANNWDTANAVIAAWIWNSNSSEGNEGALYLGKKMPKEEANNKEHIYKFTGLPTGDTAPNMIKFLRLNPSGNIENGSFTYPTSTSIWNSTGDQNLFLGRLYTITGWGTVTVDNSDYTFNKIKYETTKFIPVDDSFAALNKVNYLWVDDFAGLQGSDDDGIKGMTGQTAADGSFSLMYGTGSVESSAEFEHQFKQGSFMRVTQQDTLFYPDRGSENNPTTVEFKSTSSGAGPRTVSKYYNTTVRCYDREKNYTELTINNNSLGKETTYTFDHIAPEAGSGKNAVDPALKVLMTEEFENTVKVGAISVTKALKYGETGPVQDHTFKLTLTNVMEQEGVNVTDYSNISVTGATSDELTADGKFTIHGTNTATITGIPAYTTYTVTEVTPGSYFEPDAIDKGTGKVQEGTGENNATPDNANKVTVTNKRKVGSLTLAKTVMGDYTTAGITKGTTEFTYTVILTHPDNVDLRDYLTWSSFDGIGATVTKINGSDFTSNTESAYNAITDTLESIEFTVAVKCDNGSKTIGNLPMGTKYTVTENNANATGTGWTCSTTGQVSSETTLSTADPNPVVTITNNYTDTSNPPTPSSSKVILTKTAKEQVDNTKIGDKLGNAKFLLYVNDGDNNDNNDSLAGSFTLSSGEYNYGSGTVNTGTDYLVTGNDSSDTTHFGKLILNGLPIGDYYLQEEVAPDGFSNMDSNTGKKKRVYFSVGDNTVTKNIICSDEMAPAYIKLYEHINEKVEAWGNPTFIFRITQTKDADGNNIVSNNQKTQIVALTVNDDGKITDTIKWYENGTAQNFTADPINNTLYGNWLVEATSETEYKGMYHIDSQGRIRVEPGEYTITRIPVSRYEFVTSGHIVYATGTKPTGTYTVNSNSTETAETVTLTDGQTGDIHYYDKVAYYDKFSHVDTKVNKFYKLVNGENKTVKGIRIKDINGVQTSADTTVEITTNENFKLYFIYVDGTESEINDSAEKAKLNITYSGSDSAFSNASTGFSFPNNTITIKANTDFKNKVYTLNATYDNKFTTTFDLVFERTS